MFSEKDDHIIAEMVTPVQKKKKLKEFALKPRPMPKEETKQFDKKRDEHSPDNAKLE